MQANRIQLENEITRLNAEVERLRDDLDTAFHCYGKHTKMLEEGVAELIELVGDVAAMPIDDDVLEKYRELIRR